MRNLFADVVIVFHSVEKRFYAVENLVQQPVGEQDKHMNPVIESAFLEILSKGIRCLVIATETRKFVFTEISLYKDLNIKVTCPVSTTK